VIEIIKPRFEILAGYEEVATLPRRQTKESAGYDLSAITSVNLIAGSRTLIMTGLTCYMPANLEMQIRSRSGLTLAKGIIVLNAPATIDADYYGKHIGVILYNTTLDNYKVIAGERIAQAVFSQYFITSDDDPVAKEREGGFGHTGGASL
jgi:dUTP pyrophosphatase